MEIVTEQMATVAHHRLSPHLGALGAATCCAQVIVFVQLVQIVVSYFECPWGIAATMVLSYAFQVDLVVLSITKMAVKVAKMDLAKA